MQARKMLTKRWKIRVRSAVMFPAVFGGTVGGTRVCPPRRLSSPHLRWDTCVPQGDLPPLIYGGRGNLLQEISRLKRFWGNQVEMGTTSGTC